MYIKLSQEVQAEARTKIQLSCKVCNAFTALSTSKTSSRYSRRNKSTRSKTGDAKGNKTFSAENSGGASSAASCAGSFLGLGKLNRFVCGISPFLQFPKHVLGVHRIGVSHMHLLAVHIDLDFLDPVNLAENSVDCSRAAFASHLNVEGRVHPH